MAINRSQGFTVIDTLLYAAGVTLLIGVVVTVIAYAYKWYRYATIAPRVDQVGSLIVDRLENDIRDGRSLITAQDNFGVTVGSIGVNALDPTKAAVAYYYGLQNGRVVYSKNGGASQYLSPSDLYISKLRFDEIDTGESTAIHFTVSVDYQNNGATTTSSYNGLAIMRNTYQ